jgi:hypothetical protein
VKMTSKSIGDELLSQFDTLLSKVTIALANSDCNSQACTDLAAELTVARNRISVLEHQLMTANSAVVSKVEELDSAVRSSLVSSAEQISIMKKICDTADQSYELQVALSSKKMLERDILLLKSENASLANENKMLRANMEHRFPKK